MAGKSTVLLMTITADKAAEIARRHGLNLADAQALSVLADDEGHAETLAGQFAPAPPSEKLQPMKRLKAGYEKTNGAVT